MKTLILFIAMLGMPLALSASESPEIPAPVKIKIDGMLKKLRAPRTDKSYTVDMYLVDLKEIGKTAMANMPVAEKRKLAATLSYEIIVMGISMNSEKTVRAVDEIRAWYGSAAINVPRNVRFKNGCTDEQWETAQKGLKAYHVSFRRMEPLDKEKHLNEHYHIAWEICMLAPWTSEKTFMMRYFSSAFYSINEKEIIPIVTELFKGYVNRDDGGRNGGRLGTCLGMIWSSPSECALNALLECNRYAISVGYNPNSYLKEGVSVAIVRCLASRSPKDKLADLLAAKKRNGGVIPKKFRVTHENWKIYKPMIEARLKGMTKNIPKEDMDILEAALEIMPEGE